MSEKIEAALTPEEWETMEIASRDTFLRARSGEGWIEFDANLVDVAPDTYDAAPVIALANAALPDSDPRKFTWGDVDLLGDLAWDVREYLPTSCTEQFEPFVQRLADRIAALLPPRAAT